MRNLVLAGIFVCGIARAHEVKFDYSCDTPSSHFSEFSLELENGAFKFTTRVSQLEARLGGPYRSIANIFITGDTQAQSIGVLFGVSAKDSSEVEFLVQNEAKYGRGKSVGQSSSGGKDIPVELEYSSGKVQIRVAKLPVITEQLNFTPKLLRLGCSTGDYEFNGSKVVANGT